MPIRGKISRPTEFNTKTVLNETAVSSSRASMIGQTAAMALPPQIAVPAEMRKAELNGTERQRPRNIPTAMATTIPTPV